MRCAPALPRLRPDATTVMGGAVACRQLPCVLDQREIAHPKHAMEVISLPSSHMSSFVHAAGHQRDPKQRGAGAAGGEAAGAVPGQQAVQGEGQLGSLEGCPV